METALKIFFGLMLWIVLVLISEKLFDVSGLEKLSSPARIVAVTVIAVVLILLIVWIYHFALIV